MNNREFHDSQAAADFDARCKALLEHRTVDAPAPREGLFNDAGRSGMVGRWAALGAAALVISAILAPWPESQPEEVNPVSEITEIEASSATEVPTPDVEMADAELDAEVPTIQEHEADMVDQEIAVAVKQHEAIVTSEMMEEGIVEGAVEVGGIEDLNTPVETQTSESPELPVDLESIEPVEPPSVSAVEAEEIPSASEDAEGAPTLKLPLKLKSGGGQQ